MKMKKLNVCLGIIIALFVMSLTACSMLQPPDYFTAQQKAEYTSLETLKAAKEFRVFALGSAGAIYKRGLMDDVTKDKLIKIGDELQASINVAADTLVLYKKYGDAANKATLEEKINSYQALFNQFLELVTPYLTEGA